MTDELVLDAVDQRVLGSLLEKQRTVPASYPMTLNALQTACNQTSSRDPVVDYDQPMLLETLKSLKERGLVRVVWADRGPRTLKYHQLLDERLALQPDERALLTVLLLRGPQAPGELRDAHRALHAFADREEVEAVLRRMARHRPTPLVRELERRPGQQDRRWVHLLGPVEAEQAARRGPAGRRPRERARRGRGRPRREGAGGVRRGGHGVRRAARRRARPQALRPLAARTAWRRWRTAPRSSTSAPARATSRRTSPRPGPTSPASTCRRRWSRRRGGGSRTSTFAVGDLTDLLRPPAAAGWGAITAWYALVHLAGSELAPTVASLARVLAPGGWLALALHAGAEVRHADELFGERVDVDFVLHDPDDVLAAVRAAGLVDVEWYLRGPYAGAEVETERLYVLARRP